VVINFHLDHMGPTPFYIVRGFGLIEIEVNMHGVLKNGMFFGKCGGLL
jgi:hypothetical protein